MPPEDSPRKSASDSASRTSRQGRRTALDRLSDPFFALDENWRIAYANSEAGRLLGSSANELLGRDLRSALSNPGAFATAFRRARAEQKVVEFVNYSEPSRRWYENRIYPSRDGVSILLHDVTEEKEAEEAAKDTLALLKGQTEVLKLIARGEPLHVTLDALLRIVEAQSPGMLASVLLLDPDGVHVRHGAAPSLPKTYVNLINGEAIGPCAGSCGTAAYRREPVIVEDIATDPLWENYRELALKHDLRACWSTPIFDEEHRVLGTFALYFRSPGLPTERHKKQIAMVTATASIAIVKNRERESLIAVNKRLTLALAAGNIGIWERDLPSNRVTWSSQLKALFGRSEADELDTFDDFLQAVHPDDRARVLSAIDRSLSKRTPYDLEFRVVWRDGAVHWVAVRGKPELDADNRPVRMRGVALDITERKRVQEESKAREVQLADAERVASFGSFEWLPATQSVRWTDEMYIIFGLKPDKFQPTLEGYLAHVHPEDREGTRRIIETSMRDRSPFEVEDRIIRPDGSVRWLFSKGQWLFDENRQSEKLVGTCQDVTAQKEAELARAQLEQQLRQTQKMESVGRLAGGVAHDFNNVLSVIIGHIELARDALRPDSPVLRHIQQIQKAADRAAALTRHLLAFSRRDVIQPTILDLNVVVNNLMKMMSPLVGENIALRITTSPRPGKVKADLGQIDQIVMNLVVNAIDAMPNGGKIFIEVANTQLDENFTRKYAAARPGPYVMLSVSDTGCGIDEQVLSKIFEPFFTTKPAGRGTGLGLSMVQGAVEHNGGLIDVYSHVGKGTTFKIYFPRVEEVPEATSVSQEQTLRKGSETILLVEDDEALRHLAATLLTRQGYKVLEAKNGASAMAIAREYPQEIHLLLTDVVLPDLNGVELVGKVKSHRASTKVLYMSGYPGELLSHHGVLDPGVLLLPKPFTKTDLMARVNAALEK